jgi:hypothetical protein
MLVTDGTNALLPLQAILLAITPSYGQSSARKVPVGAGMHLADNGKSAIYNYYIL